VLNAAAGGWGAGGRAYPGDDLVAGVTDATRLTAAH
jgi:hypothetical protein